MTSTYSNSRASRSATAPVPSGEPSSITSTRTACAPSARSIGSRFWRSLYVGRQTVTRIARRIIASVPKALPRNADVAEQLELLADILELEGEAAYRVLAYRRAAARVRETSGLVAELALDGRAKELPGIGKTIEEKIVQIVDDGEIHALTKHKALVPPEVVAFTRLPGLGPKTARKMRPLLGQGLPAVQAVVGVLRDHEVALEVSEAGSVRRRKETFRDLDIIATATAPAELTDYFT